MIYCSRFAYLPAVKVLEDVEEHTDGGEWRDALVAFIQAEEGDEADMADVGKKLAKNLKWGAGKNSTRNIVLHSFAHLSESKASPEFTASLFSKVKERLAGSEYQVSQTPFGYFLDLSLNAPGYSQARVFKSF
jgi:hypothetical protein